jgi:MFS family permease
LAALPWRRTPSGVAEISAGCAILKASLMKNSSPSFGVVQTDIPFRLDRLPRSRFHLLVVVGLGITWILDGLEVTIVGSIGPALQSAETLHLSSAEVGAVASFYVVGAVTGALGFGWLTDRFGRRFVFYVTLIVYLTGVLLSAFAWDFWSFAFSRMVTGLGIGGEYAAVNSAIDELIPAKYRGRIDLIVNGTFWLRCRRGVGIPYSAGSASVPRQYRLAAGLRNWRNAGNFNLDA